MVIFSLPKNQKNVKPLFKKISQIGLVLGCVVGLSLVAEKATANFTIARITTNLPFHPEWEVQSIDKQELASIEGIVKQKFLFLDNGGQSWVFISQDGQYVVKFFKFRFTWYDLFKNLSLPHFLEPYRPQLTSKQLAKRNRLLGGYAIAYQKMREETLLKGIFLNGKHEGLTTMHIIDKIGVSHHIDLHDKPFIIQRTAVPLVTHLTPLMKEGRIQEAQDALCSALNLIAERCAHGIIDEDHRLFCNLGFVGKQAVYLDAGSLKEDPSIALPERARNEILRSADLLIKQLDQEANIHVPPY